MPRTARVAPGGLVYHVLNRSVARLPLFQKPADYEAFERVMSEAHDRWPMRILAYCLMPNHWHFVLWPRKDGGLTDFMRWLTNTHTMRWHAHYHTSGTGHVYQGRFKAFAVEIRRNIGPSRRVCRSHFAFRQPGRSAPGQRGAGRQPDDEEEKGTHLVDAVGERQYEDALHAYDVEQAND